MDSHSINSAINDKYQRTIRSDRDYWKKQAEKARDEIGRLQIKIMNLKFRIKALEKKC